MSRNTLAFQFLDNEALAFRTDFYLDDPQVTDDMILAEVQRIFTDSLKVARATP